MGAKTITDQERLIQALREQLAQTPEFRAQLAKALLDPEAVTEATDTTGRVDGTGQPVAARPLYQVPDRSDWCLPRVGKPDKVGPEEQEVFLAHLAKNGVWWQACAAIGVTPNKVRQHRKDDPLFDELCQSALDYYKDTVISVVQKLGLEGTLEPIIGRVAKDQDGIIGWKRVHNTGLVTLEAKRVEAQYREKAGDINIGVGNGGGGVLVVGRILTLEEWLAKADSMSQPLDPLEGLPGLENGLPEIVHDDDSI